jgi:competence protein ComEA
MTTVYGCLLIKEIIMRLSVIVISALLCLGAPLLHAEASSPASAKTKVSKPVSASTERVNINTADATALVALKGVGAKKAQAILAYRKSHGAFNSLEQFEAVPGIGPSIIAKNKSVIVFH